MFRSVFNWKNAWRIRIIALGCIVLFVGAGSQVLVNTFADDSDTGMVEVRVTAYAIDGRMTDGNWTYLGACAVSPSQFPLGTVIALYNADGSFNRQCTAEDTGGAIGYGGIDLAMPGDQAGAIQWGVRDLQARVLRWGWGNGKVLERSPTSGRPVQHIHTVHPTHITRVTHELSKVERPT